MLRPARFCPGPYARPDRCTSAWLAANVTFVSGAASAKEPWRQIRWEGYVAVAGAVFDRGPCSVPPGYDVQPSALRCAAWRSLQRRRAASEGCSGSAQPRLSASRLVPAGGCVLGEAAASGSELFRMATPAPEPGIPRFGTEPDWMRDRAMFHPLRQVAPLHWERCRQREAASRKAEVLRQRLSVAEGRLHLRPSGRRRSAVSLHVAGRPAAQWPSDAMQAGSRRGRRRRRKARRPA